MPQVIFSHPAVDPLMARNRTPGGQSLYEGNRICIQDDGSLQIWTGPDQITWGYNLNTVTHPTYGGEVVQILSANIDDLTVGGDLRNYTMMEDIYLWFMVYMSVATQGWREAGVSGHNEEPVTMWYPERQWQFDIRPKNLPGFRIATDVVTPKWQIVAHVVQGDADAEVLTLKGAIEGLSEIHAGIGYEEFNPFSTPSNKAKYESQSGVGAIGKDMAQTYEDFSSGNFDYLTKPIISGPPKVKTTKQDK